MRVALRDEKGSGGELCGGNCGGVGKPFFQAVRLTREEKRWLQWQFCWMNVAHGSSPLAIDFLHCTVPSTS